MTEQANSDFSWDLDVNYDFKSEIESAFELDANYESDVSVNADIDVSVDIASNLATFNADVQAIGDDGATELNLQAIATEDYSSITMSGYSAVAGDCDCDDVDPPPPPSDDFPVWPQDISNVVLYFDTDEGDTNDDGFLLVKVDNWPSAGNDDLDESIDEILDHLIAENVIEEGTELLGAAIKGGTQDSAYFAYGDSNTNGTAPDPIPAGAPVFETPPPQGQIPGPSIDVTVNYSDIFA